MTRNRNDGSPRRDDAGRIVEARVLDETMALQLDELCSRLHVERQWVVELVEIGAIEPRGGVDPAGWAFAAETVPRLRAITRLVEDLGVNLAGAALILELADDRRRLLARLRQFVADVD